MIFEILLACLLAERQLFIINITKFLGKIVSKSNWNLC